MAEKNLFWLLAILTLMIALATVGCGNIQFDETQTNIEVKSGQEFVISLDSNPSTGYSWQISKPISSTILKQINKEYKASEPVKPGSGGKELWTFKALAKGKTIIAFDYTRPWEKNVPSLKEKTFNLVVD